MKIFELPFFVCVLIVCLKIVFNPLNAELMSICHLLALLGAHHILHVSGVRVNNKYATLVVGLFVSRTYCHYFMFIYVGENSS